MKVLVAMEFSGIVRDAFIKKGHDAMSCDFLATESPGPHYQGDVYDILFSQKWDLIIAHPECTKLCVSGNSTYGKNRDGSPKLRHQERLDAAAWTEQFWNDCKHQAKKVCFENPVGVLTTLTNMPRPQYIQPWMFGHLRMKKTGLFLYNLPELLETNNVYKEMILLPKNIREENHYLPPSVDRWKKRSETYQGIADAFAEQWG